MHLIFRTLKINATDNSDGALDELFYKSKISTRLKKLIKKLCASDKSTTVSLQYFPTHNKDHAVVNGDEGTMQLLFKAETLVHVGRHVALFKNA
jgi:hypothetical protein